MKHLIAYVFALVFTIVALALIAPDLIGRHAPSLGIVYAAIGLLIGAVALAAPASLEQALGVVAPYLPAMFRASRTVSALPQAEAGPEVSHDE